jgi:hypothetical protein
MKTKVGFLPGNSYLESLLLLAFMLGLFSACTVTNNLYVNNPVPLTKGNYEVYGGLGLGLKPQIDSITNSGEVFSHDFRTSYYLVFGGRYAFTDQFNVSGSMHLPEILGGFGANIRPQISLMSRESKLNMALAADIGGVFFQDSISPFGIEIDIDPETRGAFNIDFSNPLGVKLGKETWLVFSPRYSFTWFYFRKAFDHNDSKNFLVRYPALSLGLRAKRIHLELSAAKVNNKNRYFAGLVYFFNPGTQVHSDLGY